MAAAQAVQNPKRVCFVTIGATASFNALLEAVLTQTFLQALQTLGYTDLLVQHGLEGGSIFREFLNGDRDATLPNGRLNISGFDFNKQGLGQEMRAAKGENGDLEGVVISHAGRRIGISCIFISISSHKRDRFNPRRSPHLRPTYRSAKLYSAGQPPNGAGRRVS